MVFKHIIRELIISDIIDLNHEHITSQVILEWNILFKDSTTEVSYRDEEDGPMPVYTVSNVKGNKLIVYICKKFADLIVFNRDYINFYTKYIEEQEEDQVKILLKELLNKYHHVLKLDNYNRDAGIMLLNMKKGE